MRAVTFNDVFVTRKYNLRVRCLAREAAVGSIRRRTPRAAGAPRADYNGTVV